MENEDSKSITDKLTQAIAGDKFLSDSISELAESLKDLANAIHRAVDVFQDVKYRY